MWYIQDSATLVTMKTVLLLVLIPLVQCSINNIICVRCSNGSLNTGTWNQNCTEICDSISECDFNTQVPTLIALEFGYHVLSKSLQLRERSLIKIQGSSQGTRISCMDTRLLFFNIHDLHISNLTIENCGAIHHSVYHTNLTSAVFISEGETVTLLNLNISHSSGNGISLFNIHGKIVVNGSIFLCSNMGNFNSHVGGSSGLYIEYNGYESTLNTSEDGTQIVINNSKFIGRLDNTQSNIIDQINKPMTRGLSFIFSGCTSHISSNINESVFSGNAAITGSGLFLHFLNSSNNNSITVSSSNFTDNVCIRASGEAKRKEYGGGSVNVVFDDNSSYNAVVIEESNFMKSTALTGGGLFILFLNCSHGNSMDVITSNFSNNNQWDNATKLGGGLSLLLMDGSYSNDISLIRCILAENRAMRGAGMYARFQNLSKDNNLTIIRSVFIRNRSPDTMNREEGGGGGGGIEVGYHFLGEYAPTNNSVSIIHCQFKHNFANFGGGTLLYSSYALRTDINNSFNLTDCLWQKNSANYGAAIDLSAKLSVHDYPPQGILPIPVFEDCIFIMNKVVNNIDKNNVGIVRTSVGKGTFISTAMSAHFIGTTRFEHCTGSAIHVTSCFLTFSKHSNVTFSHNTGSLGGAIGLVGRSSILVQDHSRFSFINNSAVLNGGAISYFTTNKHNFDSFRNCFIEYIGQTKDITERDIEFLFNQNTAPVGNSIYTTTVEHCNRHLSCTTNLFSCIANFTFESEDGKSINYQLASAGVKFRVNDSHPFPLSVIPGKLFEIPIVTLDEFDHPVQSLYNLRLSDTSSSSVPEAYSVLLKSNKTRIYGNPGNSIEVTMFTKDGLHETELKFNVTFQNCPPGYVLERINSQPSYNSCICSSGFYVGIQCNSSALLLRGFWIGYDGNNPPSEDNLISGHCPEGYCNQRSRTVYPLPSFASWKDLDQQVCAKGRTGILCGRCQSNYSVFYHGWTMRCLNEEKCSYGPLIYVLLELLPITVMFVIVIIFDVPFTSGAANGFLLFSQVIDTLQIRANRFIWFSAPIYSINTASIRFVYKVFSLQFFTANDIERLKFLSFCLWKGSTALDMLAFHYVTLLYSLLLVAFTVKVINSCNIRKYCCECCFKMRRKRTVRGSITHGLTTFLLLCYSRFAQVSLMILIPGAIYGKGGAYKRQVVFYDGEVGFFSKTHLAYAVPALMISVVLFLLPLLLVMYPACYKIFSILGFGESKFLSILCRVISIENLRPILDSFQGCFKDRYRFFAGLYFFYRLFAVISFAYTSHLSTFYMIVEVQLVLMLMVHALVQPYKKRWHNAADALLLADLALINALTTFSFSTSSSKFYGKDTKIVTSIQALFICLPGVYMIIYIICYILIEMCGLRQKLKCSIDTSRFQAILSKCKQYLTKNKTTDDSAIELQSLYHSYQD